jgi:hypothetical protein
LAVILMKRKKSAQRIGSNAKLFPAWPWLALIASSPLCNTIPQIHHLFSCLWANVGAVLTLALFGPWIHLSSKVCSEVPKSGRPFPMPQVVTPQCFCDQTPLSEHCHMTMTLLLCLPASSQDCHSSEGRARVSSTQWPRPLTAGPCSVSEYSSVTGLQLSAPANMG